MGVLLSPTDLPLIQAPRLAEPASREGVGILEPLISENSTNLVAGEGPRGLNQHNARSRA